MWSQRSEQHSPHERGAREASASCCGEKVHAVASTEPTDSAWCFPKNNLEPFILNAPMTEAFVLKPQH